MSFFYDMSALADCTGVTGSIRSAFTYSLWTFSSDPTHMHLDDSFYWQQVRTKATAGGENGLVCMDIEPDTIPTHPTWQRATNTLDVLNPVNPHTEADVIVTQRIANERLALASQYAVAGGAELWNYRTLQVTSMSLAFNNHSTWLAETNKIVGLDNGVHADLLRVTNGGVLYEFYVPDVWNVDDAPSRDRLVTVMESYADAYDALGLRHMPLLNPFTVGGETPKTEVLMGLIQPVFDAMRKRYAGNIATWAGDYVFDPVNFATTPAAWKTMLAA